MGRNPRRNGIVSIRAPLAIRLALALGIAIALVPNLSARAGTPPWAGVLETQPDGLHDLSAHNVSRGTLAIGWALAEPSPGKFDTDYVQREVAVGQAMQRNGLQVILDVGLQYPPAWVFGLPGETRFIDQYGVQWHGGDVSTGLDVPNAVSNVAVRNAQAAYLTRLGKMLRTLRPTAVRVGGLLSGELRFPPNDASRPDALWFYDAASQRNAPYPGWIPGTGTHAQALASLRYYNNLLVQYEDWQIGMLNKAFPSSQLQLLLPGWGLRPGQLQQAVNAGLLGTTPAKQGGMITSGSDFAAQAQALAKGTKRGVLYSTWLEAPSYGSDAQHKAPIYYIADLGRQLHLPLAGESSGFDGPAELATCVNRVEALRLQGFLWMNESDLRTNRYGVDLDDFSHSVASLH